MVASQIAKFGEILENPGHWHDKAGQYAAKTAAARLAGHEPPRHDDNETTPEGLRARIATVLAYLKTFTPADFDGVAPRVVALTFVPGKGLREDDYLHELATTASSILRHNGVDPGKANFIGSLNLCDA
jgi:hypothetical protein